VKFEHQNTYVIHLRFDNRVKELRTPEEANKYLSGEGLPPNKKPFFISLPVHRNLDSKEFKDAIRACYLADYKSLLSIRFDEKRYVP
jgi:hypothetical protein